MTEQTTQRSPYPRENYWGALNDETSAQPPATERRDPNDPVERVAVQLLRESAAILCARSLAEDDTQTELTAPQLYIGQSGRDESPPGEYGQQSIPRRYNPETGYIAGGETTATVVADRPEDAFLAIVDAWLEYLAGRLPQPQRDTLRQEALRLKRGGELSDVAIMTRLVRWVRDDAIPDRD